jgi:uncharacterized membrane protein
METLISVFGGIAVFAVILSAVLLISLFVDVRRAIAAHRRAERDRLDDLARNGMHSGRTVREG